jgi:hypothetical protein
VPIDPFQNCIFHCFEATLRPTSVNDPRFEQAVDRFGQCVTIGIPNTADRWREFGLG